MGQNGTLFHVEQVGEIQLPEPPTPGIPMSVREAKDAVSDGSGVVVPMKSLAEIRKLGANLGSAGALEVRKGLVLIAAEHSEATIAMADELMKGGLDAESFHHVATVKTACVGMILKAAEALSTEQPLIEANTPAKLSY